MTLLHWAHGREPVAIRIHQPVGISPAPIPILYRIQISNGKEHNKPMWASTLDYWMKKSLSLLMVITNTQRICSDQYLSLLFQDTAITWRMTAKSQTRELS